MTVEAKQLTKTFYDPIRGEFDAVDRVNFVCPPGQIFGLLGPNGAGKTTTLRMITTILKPTSGSVTISGLDVVKDAEKVRRHIGFLSSDTHLYERLTPREIMEYFGHLSGIDEESLKKRIVELIGMFDMKTFADVRCAKLSTGMRQKASIARAIVHDPDVVILDEPTNGLDVLGIQAMHEFILESKRLNKSVIFSSHIMNEAEKLCDVIAIISDGRVLAIGTLQELKELTGKPTMDEVFLAVIKGKGLSEVNPSSSTVLSRSVEGASDGGTVLEPIDATNGTDTK